MRAFRKTVQKCPFRWSHCLPTITCPLLVWHLHRSVGQFGGFGSGLHRCSHQLLAATATYVPAHVVILVVVVRVVVTLDRVVPPEVTLGLEAKMGLVGAHLH